MLGAAPLFFGNDNHVSSLDFVALKSRGKFPVRSEGLLPSDSGGCGDYLTFSEISFRLSRSADDRRAERGFSGLIPYSPVKFGPHRLRAKQQIIG